MKETLNRLSEKQIALITLALTAMALVIGIALPEIRTMLGLEAAYETRSDRSKGSRDGKKYADLGIPKPPAPPGTAVALPVTEIKQDYSNSGSQTGEFIVFSGVTFKNTGFLKGKVVIQKGATFVNNGAIEGTVVNKGGKFENTGYLDGPLTVE